MERKWWRKPCGGAFHLKRWERNWPGAVSAISEPHPGTILAPCFIFRHLLYRGLFQACSTAKFIDLHVCACISSHASHSLYLDSLQAFSGFLLFFFFFLPTSRHIRNIITEFKMSTIDNFISLPFFSILCFNLGCGIMGWSWGGDGGTSYAQGPALCSG